MTPGRVGSSPKDLTPSVDPKGPAPAKARPVARPAPAAAPEDVWQLSAQLGDALAGGRVGPRQAQSILSGLGTDAAHLPEDLHATLESLYLANIDSFQTPAQKIMQDYLFPNGLVPQTGSEPAAMAGDNADWGAAYGKLFVRGVRGTDLKQGADGDCWYDASVVSIAHANRAALANLFTENPDGTVGVHLFQKNADGTYSPTVVTVDRSVPEDPKTGQPLFDTARPVHEIWPLLIEKAFAQLRGGYADINGGLPADALSALTGLPSSTVEVPSTAPDALYNQIRFETDRHQPVVAYTWCDGAHDALFEQTGRPPDGSGETGVVAKHAYSVLGAKEVNGQRYVILRNPWGWHTPDSTLADNPFARPAGEEPPDDTTVKGEDGATNGIFLLPLAQFQALYPEMSYPDPKAVGLENSPL